MTRFPVDDQVRHLAQEGDQNFYSARRLEAIRFYAQALAIEPDCVYVLVQRGLALQEEGNLTEAIEHYNKAIELDPEYGPAYYGRGWARNWQGDHEGELIDAQQGYELDPDNPGMYLRRIGAALSGLKRFDEAIEYYTKAIKIHPNDEGTIYNRGVTYILMRKPALAMKDFNRALELDPDWSWALYHRGIAYEMLNDLENAMLDIESTIRYDPKYQKAYIARERIKEKLGKRKKGGFLNRLFGSH